MRPKSHVFMYLSILISLLFLMASLPLHAAEMKDYCIVPPYVKRDVQPNILIIMDNAEIMGDAAYTDVYDPSKTYTGLFKNNLMYSYSSSSWVPSAAGIYIGNLLNWATTSKYDLLQNILLGGKSASRQTNINTLQSISNSWTKTLTYTDSDGTTRICKFVVSSANVDVQDATPGSCGYLDSPAKPMVASNESDTKFATDLSGNRKADTIIPDSLFKSVAQQTLSFLHDFMDFLVPDAEAAPKLRLPSGNPPSGTECTAYSATITASGGTETGYTWSVTSGNLPAGLTLTSDTPSVTISGTPTVASGTYTFTLRVCDSAGCIANHMDSNSYNLVIADAAVTITTASPMTSGTVGGWYRAPIRASGSCTSTTTWLQTAGTLPPGLSLGACTTGSNCIDLNGTPTTAGTYNFTVQVTDSQSNISSKAFSITINPAVGTFIISSPATLTDATLNEAYQIDIATSGFHCGSCCSCPATYTWSYTGTLPPGISFNPAGAPCVSGDHIYLKGTPTSLGPYTFTISVTENCTGYTNTATEAFSLSVTRKAPVIRTTGNLSVKVCAGDYAVNCSNPDTTSPYDPPCSASYTDQCVLKSGIIDQFWTQARYGLQDFSKQASEAVPGVSKCIVSSPGANPDPDFVDAVQNAVPIPVITTLVNGEYTAIDYYANDTSNNCNPFRDSQSCQRNFVLMITSGVGADNPPTPSGGTPNVYTDATNCGASSLKNLSKNSCFGNNVDLRNSPTFGGENLPGRQVLNTYIVNTMGTPKTSSGPDCPATAVSTGDMLCQAAVAGGGVYYEVVDPTTLKQTLIQAFQDILKRAAAGTAASVLASGEGSGANLIQAVFYPRRKVGNTEIAWTGRLTNFWFYVDPFFSASSIYEDNAGAGYFNLTQDDRVSFYYDPTFEKTMAHRYPPTGTLPDIEFENLSTLWESGYKLWERDATTRTIKTPMQTGLTENPGGSGLADFSTGGASVLRSSLALAGTEGDFNHDSFVDDTDAELLIRYIRGEDFPSYSWIRTRTMSFSGVSNVWKLSDILNSTPKISSWIPLGTYDQTYIDTSYKNFIASSTYTNRGMVFAGGNDGMLHAFKLGKLELKSNPVNCTFGSSDIACLSNPSGYLGGSGTPVGYEMWAFMPRNALPYLKYLKDPDYCHIFTIDLSPYIFDASIGAPGSGNISGDDKPTDGSTWRTIIIGGMRFGGACKNTCADLDCVQTPAPNIGYSSYFALDITDQSNPKLLWEFSNENLGLTTTGPSIVKVGDRAKNGKWFAVFGSGPTGTVSKTDQQFLGHSNQNLTVFVLDLKTGNIARSIDTGIPNAFAGSMINSTLDADQNYQDDVVYVPYVKKAGDGNWTDGGVYRILTKESTSPSDWSHSTVIDGVGPVTSAVTRLLNINKRQLWIFFGTGRYYFEQQAKVDDENGQRSLFGIKEPCYLASGLDVSCTTAFSGSLTNVSNTPDADPSAIADGWRINLDASGNYTYCEVRNPDGTCAQSIQRFYRAERVITDPLTTTSGLVFFVSYKPYSDVCAYGGKSFIWAVRYNTGGAAGAKLKGVALLQVSTGSIEQVDLSKAFTESGGRKSSALEGVPPTAQGLSILSQPPPVKRVLHIKER
jgi:Tfp pilus tip-associated adhesin PilY1